MCYIVSSHNDLDTGKIYALILYPTLSQSTWHEITSLIQIIAKVDKTTAA